MSGKALLILLSGIIAVSIGMFRNISQASNEAGKNASVHYYSEMAQNIAQTGVNLALRRLVKNPNWRTGYDNEDMYGGTLSLTLDTMTFNGQPAIRIISTGISGSGTEMSKSSVCTTYVKRTSPGSPYIPAAIRGAITTNNNVRTLGGLVVDGRDHTEDGILIPGQGTYGIWTTGILDRGGSSTIGSTYGGTDYSPDNTETDYVREESQVYPGGYPSTPDSILGGTSKGFPQGRLKAMAESGIGGSQYVTDPSQLIYPLKGITYVELPDNDTWQSTDITGTGILIIHNNYLNAKIKNANVGIFRGLLIVDDIVDVHTDVIGALVSLTPYPSDGNCMGNGTGRILYSNQTIKAAIGTAIKLNNPPIGSCATNVLAWWE